MGTRRIPFPKSVIRLDKHIYPHVDLGLLCTKSSIVNRSTSQLTQASLRVDVHMPKRISLVTEATT